MTPVRPAPSEWRERVTAVVEPGIREHWPIDEWCTALLPLLAEAQAEALAEVERLTREWDEIVRARNYAMGQRDDERRAKEGNIAALNAAILRAESAESEVADLRAERGNWRAREVVAIGKERDELRAAVERVKALATVWASTLDATCCESCQQVVYSRHDCADDLRAALDGA